MRNVFVHHDGALGDVLLSLACISALRGEGRRIHLAARQDVGGLLRETGCVDDVFSSDNGLFTPLYNGASDERLQRFLAAYEGAFIFSRREDPPLADEVRERIPCTMTIRTVPLPGERVHAAEFRYRQIMPGGAFPEGPFLRPAGHAVDRADALLDRWGYDGRRELVAIHPGSGGKAKCWSLENYFRLVDRFTRELGAFVMILVGPAEGPAFRGRVEEYCRGRTNSIPVLDQDLAVLAALLGRSGLYVGNDSGVSHLAAAAGCRVAALFGPSDPHIWSPVGRSVVCIASPNLAELDVDTVLRRIMAMPVEPR